MLRLCPCISIFSLYTLIFIFQIIHTAQKNLTILTILVKLIHYMRRKGENSMAKKRNIIVGQSGGPTSVINSSLAGVYKNAILFSPLRRI